MSWDRQPVAQALTAMLAAATANSVYVHETPPEVLNPLAVVVMRESTVSYATGALAVDEVELPIAVVGGIEQDDAISGLRVTCRQAIEADPTLKGTVIRAWPTGHRNWRNITGAGGIQLLYVELVLEILM